MDFSENSLEPYTASLGESLTLKENMRYEATSVAAMFIAFVYF